MTSNNPRCPHCGGAMPPAQTAKAPTPSTSPRCHWRKARGGITSWCILPEGHDGYHETRTDRGPE